MRLMYLLPLAQRLLRFSSALSSLPGHVPTQEVNSAAEEKLAAVAATSAITCCAESIPKPGNFGQANDRVLIRPHDFGDHRVNCGNLLVDLPEPLQLQAEHPPVRGMGSSRQRFNQLFFAAPQSFIAQDRKVPGIGLILRQSMQNTKAACSEQIGDHYGQLDTHLFQKTLDLTMQTNPVAYQLQLHPGHVPPDALFPIGHEAQD
jgi:hypothetical protein